MKIHHALIVLILISVVFIGATSFIDDLGENYGQTADYSNINATQGMITQQQNYIENSFNNISRVRLNPDPDTDEVPAYVLVQEGWGILTQMFTSWTILGTMITELSGAIGIPAYIVASLIAIMLTIVIAMILYMIFKWKIEN